MKNNPSYRQLARESLKGNWGGAIAVCIIVIALSSFINAIPMVGTLVSFLIAGQLAVAETIYFTKLNNNETPEVGILFNNFTQTLVGNFVAHLLVTIYTFLWSLLFIIPGIVKSYAYSMTMFIRSKNPELTANESIALSHRMTNGKKLSLFFLDLSFIGWFLLSLLTFGIGLIFLMPYVKSARVAFYEDAYNEYMDKFIAENPQLVNNILVQQPQQPQEPQDPVIE